MGGSAGFSLHTGAFNDPDFSSPVSTNWLLYVCGYDVSETALVLYAVAFDASRNMTTGTPSRALPLTPAFTLISEYSPLTELLNGGTDWLFGSILATSSPNMASANINTFPTGLSHFATEGGGTSGIIVDNVSTQNQASSIYFGMIGTSHLAVKLTQGTLQ